MRSLAIVAGERAYAWATLQVVLQTPYGNIARILAASHSSCEPT